MSGAAVLALYDVVMRLAGPLLRLRLARRARAEPGYGEAVRERFGVYAGAPTAGCIWIHAVSYGEVRAAGPLVAEVRRRWPGATLLFTHGTATGRAEGARLMQPGDAQVWLPWDTAGAVSAFLRHHQPRLGILVETEVWPRLAASCRAQGVPLVLVNARLSERSLARSRRLSMLALPAYAALAAVYAQSEADAANLRALGAPVAGVFGNLKFDMAPDPHQREVGRRWSEAHPEKPVVLLASSREGEEALWLDALADTAPAARDAVQWLVVPRHPQRFDEVAQAIRARGFEVSRRSTWGPEGPPAAGGTNTIWLGDSMGEMALYYSLARVALLGGSFAPLGGQNLIEAAACACPVVMGPHTFNFREAAEQSIAAGAAWRAADLPGAVRAALALVTNPVAQAEAGQAGLRFASQHRGAAVRTADALLQRDFLKP